MRRLVSLIGIVVFTFIAAAPSCAEEPLPDHSVGPDRFDSKVQYSTDVSETRQSGNHPLLVRVGS